MRILFPKTKKKKGYNFHTHARIFSPFRPRFFLPVFVTVRLLPPVFPFFFSLPFLQVSWLALREFAWESFGAVGLNLAVTNLKTSRIAKMQCNYKFKSTRNWTEVSGRQLKYQSVLRSAVRIRLAVEFYRRLGITAGVTHFNHV